MSVKSQAQATSTMSAVTNTHKRVPQTAAILHTHLTIDRSIFQFSQNQKLKRKTNSRIQKKDKTQKD